QWDGSQKASGIQSHTDAAQAGLHQHAVDNLWNDGFYVQATDRLVAYVLIDPCDPPQELMLQWQTPEGWEHRAYWGADLINWGTPGTPGRVYMGPLPATGQWVRLEVAASDVDLGGQTLGGIAFTQWSGRTWWDRVGKTAVCFTTSVTPPASLPADNIWLDDALPPGANTFGPWTWSVAQRASGTRSQTEPSINW